MRRGHNQSPPVGGWQPVVAFHAMPMLLAGSFWHSVEARSPSLGARPSLLRGASELNGRKGRCISFDGQSGRWKVDLGDDYKSIRPENLDPSPGERPPTRESAQQEKGALAKEQVVSVEPKLTVSERHAKDYGWDET